MQGSPAQMLPNSKTPSTQKKGGPPKKLSEIPVQKRIASHLPVPGFRPRFPRSPRFPSGFRPKLRLPRFLPKRNGSLRARPVRIWKRSFRSISTAKSEVTNGLGLTPHQSKNAVRPTSPAGRTTRPSSQLGWRRSSKRCGWMTELGRRHGRGSCSISPRVRSAGYTCRRDGN